MRSERWLAVSVAAALSIISPCAAPAAVAADNRACGLVTAGEFQTLLGATVTMRPQQMGNVEACVGESAPATVSLRLIKRTTDPSGDKEHKGLELMKKMGAQVDVKTFGNIVCTSIVPPADKAVAGYNTTCSVNKAPMFAVVEVTAKTQKDMVSIERLHAVAEKMTGRFQ